MNTREFLVNDTLHDGSPVIVRAIEPEDKTALQEGLNRLSSESAYSRFFYPKRKFSQRELDFLTEIDFETHAAIGVGLVEGGDTLPIGIGRYIVDGSNPRRAEIAFTVADDFQGIGVGSLLLKHLVAIARDNGIEEFFATTLAANQKMIRVFEHSKLPIIRQETEGVAEISLRLNEQ